MFEISIKFKSNDIKDINKVLNVIKNQIKDGEIEFNDQGLITKNGYLMNKFNNIKINDKDGYSIGQFRILEESKEERKIKFLDD
jgi:hypothetical protein